ncbi:Tetratricopeptide repeat protein [Lacunisphaera limnophila]|uniref:Tetratricopeptide repeat protein n=1 Tax=Lacunisphaera limnophila TaxID=1838286 RepID=A0A1D8AZ83_9BACT|nr:tetratricopeptide repeat protein [Lacunisphaera limnophila]AOS46199.1 Tetratricopeptide repeat protein [Lacunisphaera limnophila]
MRRLLLPLTLATVLPAFAADQATRDQVAELFKQRQWAEAQAVLEKVTAAEPANAEAWNSLGLTHLARQDAVRAVTAFEKAVQLDPTKSEYVLQAGHAYGVSAVQAGLFGKMGFARKCKAAYDKAVELDPANINARWSLMEFCRQAPGFLGGGMEPAYAQAEAIRRLDARRGRAAYASLYSAEKKYAQAFALYEEVLRTQPADDDALFQVGRLAARSGEQLDRGLAALRQLATLPDRAGDARLHTLVGNILEKKGDKPGARAAYETALAGDPQYPQALEALRKLKEG